MATLYGTYGDYRLVDVPQTLVPAHSQHGSIRVMYDSYTASGALTAGDIIRMGIIPAGARVVGYWLKSSDLGTTGSLDLGWAASSDSAVSADDDGFLDAVDVNAAAITVGHQDQENMTGLGKHFSSAVEVQVRVNATTTAAGTIEACIFYVVS